MSVFMAATRKAPEPHAGSSRLRPAARRGGGAAEVGVEAQQQLGHREELTRRWRDSRINLVEDELVDGLLAKVAGDFRSGVVSAEFFLVDVFLEDVAEDVGIDFVVVATGRVVEIPGVALEESEEVLER